MNKRYIYMLIVIIGTALPLQSSIAALSAKAAAKELFAKQVLQAGAMGLHVSEQNIMRAHLASLGGKATNVASQLASNAVKATSVTSGVVAHTVPALATPVKKGAKALAAAFFAIPAVKRALYVLNIIGGCDLALNGARLLDEKIAANALARRPLYLKAFDGLTNNKYSAAATVLGLSACAGLGYWAIQSKRAKQKLSA